MRASYLRRLAIVAAVFGVLSGGPFAASALASHGRYNHVTWTELGPNTADFTVNGGFRRSGYSGTAPDGRPAIGDIINEGIGATSLIFGDGSATGTLRFLVTAINPSEDWLLGLALEPGSNTKTTITHAYSSGGPFTARIDTCCTIGALNNNGDGGYRAETLVHFGNEDESPRSSVPPIVTVGNSGVQTWPVPAIDPGGETLRWRLATAAEACDGACNGAHQPPGLAINANTGIVTWNTTGVATGLWFTSVMIEALNGAGAVVSTSQVQYLINVAVVGTNLPPDWDEPPTPPQGSEFTVAVGASLTISLQASDPNAGDTVHIDHLGLPPGATLTSTDGNPATASFSWTPAPGQEGDYLVTFTATDNGTPALSAVARTFIIHVVSPGGDTEDPSCVLFATNPGPPKQIVIAVQDDESGVASIVVIKSTNAVTVVPPFLPGETGVIFVTSTKIDQSQSSVVALRVTDVAGNSIECDPVWPGRKKTAVNRFKRLDAQRAALHLRLS
jgi:hypothetical protein